MNVSKTIYSGDTELFECYDKVYIQTLYGEQIIFSHDTALNALHALEQWKERRGEMEAEKMKEIKTVIVGKLPESTKQCIFCEKQDDPDLFSFKENVKCNFTEQWQCLDYEDFITERCPGCPLVVEEYHVEEEE